MIDVNQIQYGQPLVDFSGGIPVLRDCIAGFRLVQHSQLRTNHSSGMVQNLISEVSFGKEQIAFNRILYFLGIDMHGNYTAVYHYDYVKFGIVTFKINQDNP
jgi:hypothetical protein